MPVLGAQRIRPKLPFPLDIQDSWPHTGPMTNTEATLTPTQRRFIQNHNSCGGTATLVTMDGRYAIIAIGIAGLPGGPSRYVTVGPTGVASWK